MISILCRRPHIDRSTTALSAAQGSTELEPMATRLFVGNINHTATENDLQDHFTAAGTVLSVNIIQDKFTGKSRGFGFVEMSSPDEATKAISTFHQKEFLGRPL